MQESSRRFIRGFPALAAALIAGCATAWGSGFSGGGKSDAQIASLVGWSDAGASVDLQTLTDAVTLGTGVVKFGGSTSSFPALKRNASDLEFRLADDSARAKLLAIGADFTNNAANNTGLLNLTKSPAAGQTGTLMTITAGANASGSCLSISSSHTSTANAALDVVGNSTAQSALVVTNNAANRLGSTVFSNAQVSGDSRGVMNLADQTAFAAGVGAGLNFNAKIDAGGNYALVAAIKGIKENSTSANTAGALVFMTQANGGTQVEKLRVRSSGEVSMRSDGRIGWSNTTDTSSTMDAALLRVAAGVIGAGDGATGGSTLALGSSQQARWSSTTDPAGSADAGVGRDAIGVVKATDGSGGFAALKAGREDSGTTTALDLLTLRRTTSGTAAAGLGGRILFQVEDSAGNLDDAAQVSASWTDATSGSEDADLVVLLRAAGSSPAEKIRATSTGLLTFGGTTSSFPALKPSSAVLEVRLANDSAYATLRPSEVHLNGTDVGVAREGAALAKVTDAASGYGALKVGAEDVATTTTLAVLTSRRSTSGTAAAGLGVAHSFQLEALNGVVIDAASSSVSWADVAAGSEDADWSLRLVRAGAFAEALKVNSLGQVVTGEWQATTIGVAKGGTNLTSYAAGDLLYATGATTLAKLAIGASGTILQSTGSAPGWVALSTIDHGSLGGLADDDHAQYALLAGRASGQNLAGGTAASEVLTLRGTTHATQGHVRALASSADTSSVREVVRIQHDTSGTAAAGLGAATDTYLEDAAGNVDQAARLAFDWTDATNLSEDARLTVRLQRAGSLTDALVVDSLGNVTAATWNGTAVGATFGGTAQTTWTTGDLLYASATNVLSKLAIGSANQVLTVSGGLPVWSTAANSSGWTDNGTNVSTTTATDGVQVGATAISAARIFLVTGDATRKDVVLTGGTTTSGTAGAVTITAGGSASSGTSGGVTITAGTGTTGVTADGGQLALRAGSGPEDGTGAGGAVACDAGDGTGTNKNGGNLTFTAGDATGTGTPGAVSFTAGNFGAGGSILFDAGNASGTNIASTGHVTMRGGTGTGTGACANVVAETAFVTSAGSTGGNPAHRIFVCGQPKDLTDNVATIFATVSMNVASNVGLTIFYSINVVDASQDHQVDSGVVYIAAVNKAGVITTNVVQPLAASVDTTGLNTVTFTATSTGDLLELKVTSDTTLTPTDFKIHYTIVSNSRAVTIGPQ